MPTASGKSQDRKNDVNRVIGLAERSSVAAAEPATSGARPAFAGSRLMGSPCTSRVTGRPYRGQDLGVQRRDGLVGGQPADVDTGDSGASLDLSAGEKEVDEIDRGERQQAGADSDHPRSCAAES